MRIVVVSAHFPPNFTSGGTLVPQRLARGLRARGHDVSVYAGWLGDRLALSAWDEVDGTGLPVRWIVTSPFIGWADRRCFDNPPVAVDFEWYLRRERPDVVHLHALQSLGGDLVAVARASGARVVVTTHDFWWLCARQFLADRSLRPCSEVVACGSCECEVDRPWLDERTRWLTERLDQADLVLAPSAAAAAVLAANGVDPRRLAVHENGVAPAAPAADRTWAPGGTVRFLYAGGPDPLKGSAVLVDALRRLDGVGGWSLDAYGLGHHLEATGASLEGLPVRVHPPFDASELDGVCAAADVLVVPSVARESHSMVTREAMRRGLAVVASDCLGPEDVVVDGSTGFVVRSGDAAGLATAMERLAGDPGLVARMGAAGAGIEVATEEGQLDELEGLLAGLVAGEARPDRSAPPVRRVLFVCGIEGAPLRYRARLPAEALGLLGVECDVRHFRDRGLERLADRADAVVLYRVPATTRIAALVDRVRARRVPVVFDADDLVFDPSLAETLPALRLLDPATAALWVEGVRRYRTTLEMCDGFVGSTPALARAAAELTGLPTAVVGNGVGIEIARRAELELRRARTPGGPRLGYFTGTDTHDLDWQMVEPAVAAVLDARPDVELWLGGPLADTGALTRFGGRVVRRPTTGWLDLLAVLRDVDVNLAPLVTATAFNHAKSAIKWLEAALVETPTVASPTEPFVEAVDDGRTGLLVEGPAAWTDAIGALLDDERARRRMGAAARRAALLDLAPALQGRRYLAVLDEAREWAGRPRPASSWSPVLVDESTGHFPLEPYGEVAEAAVAAPVRAARRLREVVDRAVRR